VWDQRFGIFTGRGPIFSGFDFVGVWLSVPFPKRESSLDAKPPEAGSDVKRGDSRPRLMRAYGSSFENLLTILRGRTQGSRMMGELMQWAPPRPLPSSAPLMGITSIPSFLRRVFEAVLRS
jgi:hypothetical protein